MDEIICDCMQISRKEIVEMIHKKKLTTIQEVRKYTAANTGCGRCMPKVNAILDEEVPKFAHLIAAKKQKKKRFKLF